MLEMQNIINVGDKYYQDKIKEKALEEHIKGLTAKEYKFLKKYLHKLYKNLNLTQLKKSLTFKKNLRYQAHTLHLNQEMDMFL